MGKGDKSSLTQLKLHNNLNKGEDKIDAFSMRFKSFQCSDINKFVPRNPSIHKVVGNNQSMQKC